MAFRVDVEGGESIERDKVVDAFEVAMGYADKGLIDHVSITDLSDGQRFPLRDFDQLMRKVLGL